tara:strand:- start:195 stop:1334 length:1140 start_codon:yes stop_codon:yes gene_type:complete
MFYLAKKFFKPNKLLYISAIVLGLSLNSKSFSSTHKKIIDNSLISNESKSFITTAIEKSGPSVVTIDTQRLIKSKRILGNSNIIIDPYFERFFDFKIPYESQERVQQGQGSGVIIDNGIVITNAHVINKSEKLIVGLQDGRKFSGKVLGQDIFTDLAVIKLEGKGPWPKATLGNSDKIKVGDWAIAVGNPYGLENTVTLGIISNLNRNVSQLGIYDKKINLIQTDAAINPGNSGGPLLNSKGEVIGLNTLIRSGPGAGLSFAIPINKVKEIVNELLINGKVIHPMIGISLINETALDTNNMKVKVGYVVPKSPAAKSGLLVNDIILKVEKKNIYKSSDVVDAITKNGVNKFANILIKRNNKLININVKPVDIRDLSRNK